MLEGYHHHETRSCFLFLQLFSLQLRVYRITVLTSDFCEAILVGESKIELVEISSSSFFILFSKDHLSAKDKTHQDR